MFEDLIYTFCLFIKNTSGANWLSTLSTDLVDLLKPLDGSAKPGIAQLQTELAAIMSSYAVLPYIGEPMCTLLLPLITGALRIKRDRHSDCGICVCRAFSRHREPSVRRYDYNDYNYHIYVLALSRAVSHNYVFISFSLRPATDPRV